MTTNRIPWETFFTPLDAYQWAKACSGGLSLAPSPLGRGWWVLQLQVDMAWASRLHATDSSLGLVAITPEGIR